MTESRLSKTVLLVGDSPAATAQAKALVSTGHRLFVVAREPAAELYDWAYEGAITLKRRDFRESDLDGHRTVIAATGNTEADAAIRKAAELRLVHCVEVGPAASSKGASSSAPGKVAIVGAGPGDPELLTLRAARLLREAEVVVYDNLVGPGILELIAPEAERIFVGKSRERHHRTQEQINALLIRLARAGRRVVRLKGGDPMVFGRGGEELEALLAEGIGAELVPGITAATAAASLAGFALTHRDLASSVTFVSGQGKDGEPALDWRSLAQGRQTLVIYMGVATAVSSARRLIEYGLAPETPLAVLERVGLPGERRLFGTLRAMAGGLLEREGVKSPALIVIGEVVSAAAAREDRPAASLPLAAE